MTQKESLFRMPAEWEPHDATWIAWPHEESDWPGKFEVVKWVYTEIVRALVPSEKVCIVCADQSVKEEVVHCLEISDVPMDNVSLLIAPNDRSWLRDSAPTAVISNEGKVNWLEWKFNAWAKYDNYLADQKIPEVVASFTDLERIKALTSDGRHFVLEGGAIDVDGEGTLLATEECLLSSIQERNPGLGREDYEEIFQKYLGVSKVIWLKAGIVGDDTHGHIDDITRFVAPGVVVTVVEEDSSSENYQILQDNLKILENTRDGKGRDLKIITLPMPKARVFEGLLLPASYANFYIANTRVLVPVFNDPSDRIALQVLSEAFPDREVIGIACHDLVLGLGTLHCLTQQQPASRN
jgi:agmatine deiminase